MKFFRLNALLKTINSRISIPYIYIPYIVISPSNGSNTHTLKKQEIIIINTVNTHTLMHTHTHTQITLISVDSYAQHVYKCTVVLIVLTFTTLQTRIV